MISFYVDTDSIGEVAGFVNGVAAAFSDPDFVDKIARIAHTHASLEFDRAAAATAHAGYLSHVYEYGTPGITEGQARFADPTSPAARLYVHNLAGSGGSYDAQFVFRPAVVPNPAKTTRATGVPSRYLKKISRRKYVFNQRARLMEYGGEVNIEPKRGRFLFIPAPETERGFVMWDAELHGRGISMTVGENTAGTFTAFWEAWWGTEGQRVVDRTVNAIVGVGTQQEWAEMSARAARPDPKPPRMATAEMNKIENQTSDNVHRSLVSDVQKKAGRERK